MKFWRIENLKTQLKTGDLRDCESLSYLLAYLGLTELALVFPRPQANQWDYLLGLVGLVATVGGTAYAYRCNGGANGHHFLGRYFALGWVNAIRIASWSIPLYVVMVLVLDLPEETTWPNALFWSLFYLIIYQRLARHMREVAFPDRITPAS